MKRKKLWAAMTAVAALAVLITVLVWRSPDRSQPGRTQGYPSRTPLTAEHVQRIADDLHSGDSHRVQEAIALPAGQTVSSDVVNQLRSLQSVSVNQESLRDNGDDTASVVFVVVGADGKSISWNVTLIETDGQWKLFTSTKGA